MTKYKVWMIQEGRKKEDLIPIICVSCGKVMAEEDHFWSDVAEDSVEMFCKKACIGKTDWAYYEVQSMAFAIEACKTLGFIES